MGFYFQIAHMVNAAAIYVGLVSREGRVEKLGNAVAVKAAAVGDCRVVRDRRICQNSGAAVVGVDSATSGTRVIA